MNYTVTLTITPERLDAISSYATEESLPFEISQLLYLIWEQVELLQEEAERRRP